MNYGWQCGKHQATTSKLYNFEPNVKVIENLTPSNDFQKLFCLGIDEKTLKMSIENVQLSCYSPLILSRTVWKSKNGEFAAAPLMYLNK